ncbi:hypothetical protein OIU76_014852 [Salix suchowensis]|nr:hypothetical protein OIU76_014852 [Salix suchowensis]KAJ6345325.1 hypothetical protein OIU78_008070 [Salix suchowensis]
MHGPHEASTFEKHGQLKQEPQIKRKHGVEGEGEERDRVAEEEEEKINNSYTLVRNIRDAHDQVLTGSKEKGKGKEVHGKESKPTWTPSFSLEDFAEEDHGQFRGNFVTLLSESSKNIEDQQQPKTDQKRRNQDLDLNLSL